MNPIDFLVHQMMLPILEKSFALTGNYGWAIIFLTVIIRMLLLPLTMQSYYSTKEMQKLQPKLKKLQERYKNKPEELNKQMVALYRDHKVNPLGGCLPMLIQMPFLFALYGALIGKEFTAMLKAAGNNSFYVLPDLTHLGLYEKGLVYWENIALLTLFTLTTVLQQKIMMPPPGPDADPRQVAIQKQMQVMMPIMITAMFIMIPLPTGIFLYLVVSNLIGIGQYAYLNWHSARRDAQEATKPKQPEPIEEDEPPAGAALAFASPEGTPPLAGSPNRPKVKKATKKKKRK